MNATYRGNTTEQFTEGKVYLVQGFADSVVLILDDANMVASCSYAHLNNPKLWELKD